MLARGGDGALVAENFGAYREGVAVGRVDSEVGAVEVDSDRPQPQWDPFEDPGEGIRYSSDLRCFGIDVKRRSDDDVSEVIGTGYRRGYHRQR